MTRNQTRSLLLLGLTFGFAANTAYAQDTDDSGYVMPERVFVSLGYLALENTSTQVSLSKSDGGIGTSIDYQRDLGGDSATAAPRLTAYYRFNPRHRLDFSTYSVKRDSQRTISLRIEYGDEVYEEGDTVSSNLDTAFYKLAYGYSFYHSKRAEIGLILGLHVMDYSIKVRSETDQSKNEAADVTAPLPVWGLRVNYGITQKWFFKFAYENFYINLNDEIRGSLLDTSAGIEWRPFKHFGAGFAFVRTALDADVNTSSYSGSLADLYRGGELYIATFF